MKQAAEPFTRPARLLSCGSAAALLFNALVLGQALARPGFDLMRLPLSLLALGNWGWVQAANFLAAGALVIGCAVGVRQVVRSGPGSATGPLLLGLYGAGFVVAGIFPSDAVNGFPIGAHRPDVMSRHAQLHGAGFLLASLGLLSACLVFAYRFVRAESPRWAAASILAAIANPLLIVVGFANESLRGLAFFSSGIAGMTWLAVLSSALRPPLDAAHREKLSTKKRLPSDLPRPRRTSA